MKLSGGVVRLVFWVISVTGVRSCPEKCKISTLPTCDTDTGTCFRGCIFGYYGNTCNMSCDSNCQQGICQQRDGSCICRPGYTFDSGSCDSITDVKCKSNSHCLNNKCLSARRDDCLEGCTPGWFGQFCQQRCSPHCNCSKLTGTCTSCIPGWYGAECGSSCSPDCVDKTCHRNGTCVNGCTTGDQCDLKCTEHCVSGCDQLSGECFQCEAGRYGSICQSECSTGCAGVHNDCDHTTGECTNGCQSGFYGSFCNMTNGGLDKWSAVYSWVGGIVVVVVIIIIIICAGLCYVSRRLKRMNGVVYDIAKWRRHQPSGVDVRPVVPPGYIELEEEALANPPRVCPIRPARQTSYIEPQYSGGSGNNIQIQRQLQIVGVSDELQEAAVPTSDRLPHDVQRRSDECPYRPDSYEMPNYCEINEELMATLPQPAQGAEAPAPVVNYSSFSVVADVHAQHEHSDDGNADRTFPLIAECYGPNDTEGSPPDEEPRPDVENYEHPFRDRYTQF